MATLKDNVKLFIVQALACFDTPSQVVEAVKQEFGLSGHQGPIWEFPFRRWRLPVKAGKEQACSGRKGQLGRWYQFGAGDAPRAARQAHDCKVTARVRRAWPGRLRRIEPGDLSEVSTHFPAGFPRTLRNAETGVSPMKEAMPGRWIAQQFPRGFWRNKCAGKSELGAAQWGGFGEVLAALAEPVYA